MKPKQKTMTERRENTMDQLFPTLKIILQYLGLLLVLVEPYQRFCELYQHFQMNKINITIAVFKDSGAIINGHLYNFFLIFLIFVTFDFLYNFSVTQW